MSEKYLTLAETAARLDVSEEQLIDMTVKDELQAVMKDGDMHFREDDVDVFLASVAVVSESDGGVLELDEVDELVLLDDEDEDEVGEEEVIILEEESVEVPPESEVASETLIAEPPVEEKEEEVLFELETTAESDASFADKATIISDQFDFDEVIEDAEKEAKEEVEPEQVEEVVAADELELDEVTEDAVPDETAATIVLDEASEELELDEASDDLALAESEDDDGIGLGTEEIVFEDDDLAIGVDDDDLAPTEQVTVQEDIIALEDDSDEGMTVMEDAVNATEVINDDDLSVVEDEPSTSSRRRSARRRGGAASPQVDMSGFMPAKASIVWLVPVAATFLLSLLPFTVLMSELYQGMTLRGGFFKASQIDTHGDIPRMGRLFVPQHLGAIVGVDSNGNIKKGVDGPADWLGGMVQIDTKITLEQVKKKYESVAEVEAPAESESDDAEAQETEKSEKPKDGAEAPAKTE